MRKPQWIALSVLVAAVGLASAMADLPKPQNKDKDAPKTLYGRIAKATKFSEADTQKFLAALGPAIREMLRNGNQVEISGLGMFRVVRIPAHRDLVDGRPATITGSNYVEFLPVGDVVDSVNGPAAIPAETVPPFEYIVNPYQTPGMRAPTTRQRGSRSPGGGG